MNYEESSCIFEPSEVKMLAMHATDLYFQNMSEELRQSLMNNPIKYTTMYAEIYMNTIKEIQSNKLFREDRHRR